VRVALIGLPSAGKTTVYQALTGSRPASASEPGISAVPVPDERVDRLAAIYNPRKVIRASVEFVDLAGSAGMRRESGELGQAFLNAVRPAHALLHVVDAFSVLELADEAMAEAIGQVDAELALADLGQCEKRIARLRKEGAKAPAAQRELALLEQVAGLLGQGVALRNQPELATSEDLRSFAFLTAKPMITVINTTEQRLEVPTDGLPADLLAARSGPAGRLVILCASLEAEIAELDEDEARGFLADYGIVERARDRVIRVCYDLLGLMSFFTVGEDEVRAWTVRKGAPAVEGAAAVHSDIARGFIRAEVVDYQTVIDTGSFEEAKRAGKMRLEGKSYAIQDGDVISYRFSV
jgi:GTP-binding protein YchF